MLSLFAHHAEAMFNIEINGRDYPDGMTEHALFAGIAIAVLLLMSYGLFAAIRDIRRWRRRPVEVKA